MTFQFKIVLFDAEFIVVFSTTKTSINELRQPRKIANTYRILVKIALSDVEFIVVCVKSKNCKNQRLLAEK